MDVIGHEIEGRLDSVVSGRFENLDVGKLREYANESEDTDSTASV
jgi:hypothetical protein